MTIREDQLTYELDGALSSILELTKSKEDLVERNKRMLEEVKGAHSNSDMWLDQVHQRDKHITAANAKISELRDQIKSELDAGTLLRVDYDNLLVERDDYRNDLFALENGKIGDLKQEITNLTMQIKQGDEELRLLISDAYRAEHPDGRIRGATAAESRMSQRERDVLYHVAGEPNRFAQSKIAGLQHKNQEIGSKLGYYKQKTTELRYREKIQVTTIQRQRSNLAAAHSEITRLLKRDKKHRQDNISLIKRLEATEQRYLRAWDALGVWKRKYHTTLTSRPVEFSDLSIGRNADD